MSKSAEVLVVGAGPVGLCAALCLSKRSIPVEIVDTGVWPCTHSYALALHPQSLRLLHELGLTADVLRDSYAVTSIGIYDRQSRRAQLQVPGKDDSLAAIAVTRQDVLERALEQALRDTGVEVGWRHEVSKLTPGPDSVNASIDEFEAESRGYVVARSEWVVSNTTDRDYRFVVGADGYNSRVRRALNVDFPEVGPSQYYAVFEFKTDFDSQHEMRVILADHAADVLWPLPDGNCRWSFHLPDYSDQGTEGLTDYFAKSGRGYFPSRRSKDRRLIADWESPILDEDHLRTFLRERAPWFDGSIDELTWRTIVRFERRLATGYGHDRMWLAGDSAHLASPVGVQSMNIGLFEARDLAAALGSILRDGATSQELETYEQHWRAVWRQLQGLDGSTHEGAEAEPWIREHANELISSLPAHGAALNTYASQLGVRI